MIAHDIPDIHLFGPSRSHLFASGQNVLSAGLPLVPHVNDEVIDPGNAPSHDGACHKCIAESDEGTGPRHRIAREKVAEQIQMLSNIFAASYQQPRRCAKKRTGR
jgi:hypothetical protein